MSSKSEQPVNIILLTFVCIYFFISIKLFIVDVGYSSRDTGGAFVHMKTKFTNLDKHGSLEQNDLEVFQKTRCRETLKRVLEEANNNKSKNLRISNLLVLSQCKLLMDERTFKLASKYSKEEEEDKLTLPDKSRNNVNLKKIKVRTSVTRNGTCQSIGYSRTVFPLTALASFPGSGNTWVRHLLQEATGKLYRVRFFKQSQQIHPFAQSCKTSHATYTGLPDCHQAATRNVKRNLYGTKCSFFN